MSDVTDDDTHTLTGAYALDAIADDAERRRFETHLDECADCRQEVLELRETVAVLGQSVAQPPPAAMRARVLAEIARTPQLGPIGSGMEAQPGSESRPFTEPGPFPGAQPSDELRRRRDRSGRPAPGARLSRWAVAASVAVLAGGGLAGAGAFQLYQAEQTRQEAERVLAIVNDPQAKLITGPVTSGGTLTVVVAGQRAALLTNGVPALDDDRIYQLWIGRSGRAISVGLGPRGGDAGGEWSQVIEGVRAGDKVEISVEPVGGSPAPTTTPLAVLQV